MGNIVIGVVAKVDYIDTETWQAPESEVVGLAALVARQMIDSVDPERVNRISRICGGKELPLNVDDVAFVILTGEDKKLKSATGEDKKLKSATGDDYMFALVAMSDKEGDRVSARLFDDAPDAIMFYGNEFNEGNHEDIVLPSMRLQRDVRNCDRRATVEAGVVTPKQLMTLVCAAESTHSHVAFEDQDLRWTITPEENAEHYIVVTCGVRNPYLRRFYETRKLYF